MALFTRHPHNNRRTLLISICVFVLLDLSILGINLTITEKVESDALAINIAGRQRMLSQRITKSALQLSLEESNSKAFQQYKEEFVEVYQLFTSTLRCFKEGGLVVDSRGITLPFAALQDDKTYQLLNKTDELLVGIQPIVTLFIQGDHSKNTINLLRFQLEHRNLALLNLMNQLTTRVEDMSGEKTKLLRRAQLLAFILALLNFAHIIQLFRKSNKDALKLISYLSSLLENTSSCLLISNQRNEILLANALFRNTFGYTQDEIATFKQDDLFYLIKDRWFGKRKNGSTFAIEIHTKQFQLDKQDLNLTTIIDISHHRDRERQLADLANHDPLTGLTNRRLFYDRLERELGYAKRKTTKVALMFIDLNEFKPINDTLGHEAGDLLLITIADRLKNVMRSTDTVSRYGGDEFVIIAPDIENREQINQLLDKLCKIIEEPIDLKVQTISIHASIGIAVYPTPCSDSDHLLAAADAAMYQAKQQNLPYCFAKE